MKRKIIPFEESYIRQNKIACPYFGKLILQNSPVEITECRLATALTVYYHIFYRPLCIMETNTRLIHIPHILYRYRNYYISPTNMFSLLLNKLTPLTPGSVAELKQPKDEFYARAKALLLSSGEWDWVVPYLRKSFPQLYFGDLT